MKKQRSDFKEFIGKHYGTQTRMAKELGITTATINGWIKRNPRGILKYAPEIVKDKNVQHAVGFGAVISFLVGTQSRPIIV